MPLDFAKVHCNIVKSLKDDSSTKRHTEGYGDNEHTKITDAKLCKALSDVWVCVLWQWTCVWTNIPSAYDSSG